MRISDKSMANIQKIKELASVMESHLRYKVLGVGMIGEIECCYKMGWDLADIHNSPGYDATDQNNQKIQIKTFVTGNKTQMVPAINVKHLKEKGVYKVALVILDPELALTEILWVDVEDYNVTLSKIEQRRETQSKKTRRKKRHDVTVREFRTVKNLTTLYQTMEQHGH